MPKKFEEYLNNAGISQEERDAMKKQITSIEDVDKNQSPSDIQNSYTPDSRDAGRQPLEDQKQTGKQAGQSLHQQGAEQDSNGQVKDSLAKYDQLFEKSSKEQEQEPEL